MSFKDLHIKNEYRSFTDDIVRDFYTPVLREAVLYQRAVGFFSSSALVMLTKGIDGLVGNGGRIEIVASPRLSKEDVDEISRGYELRKVIERALLRELDAIPAECETLSYVASLVATEKLDIKIAFLSSRNEIAMYHEKMGLMTDADGNVIAFSGSMNESGNAFSMNYEAFDVFCSWTEEQERVMKKQLAFWAIWEDYEPGIQTIEFPEVVRRKLYSYNRELAEKYPVSAASEMIHEQPKSEMYLPAQFHARPYQEDAVMEWKKHGYCGIFDMATGTGKTLTALSGLWKLFTDNQERLAIIITCPYQHLVDQWVEDIETFGIRPIIGYSSSPQKNWKKNLEQAVRSFGLGVLNFFCFITTNASFVTKKIQEQVGLLGPDTVYVVDEAHNMGAGYYRRYLPENIGYRLALSATIDRYKDEAGTAALSDYFGERCITYSLKEAIRSGMLTRYYYYPVLTYLDRDELDDYLAITAQIAQAVRKKKGKIVFSEYAKQLLMRRARIIAGAKGKIPELKRQMEPHINEKHLLIYCGSATVKEDEDDEFGKRQIDLVSEMLGNDLGMRVGRFTSREDARERVQIRDAFSSGDMLQALVAIKCLDEGVNIPNIHTAFILASSTNPKEYIQRRGRVLRKAPEKDYAVIYDFVTLPFQINEIEMQNETVINATKGLIKRELIRMLDFAELAENPSITYDLVYDLKHGFRIQEEELKGEEGNSDVI